MLGHELASGIAGMILSLVAPIAHTALVAPASGTVDCSIWSAQSGITAGSATELTWWSMNASHATLTETGGSPQSVPFSGSRSVSPNTTRTYTLFVANNYGSTKTCSVTLQVSPAVVNAPSCTLSAAPGTHYAGRPVRLFWYTQNTAAASIAGIGTLDAQQLSQGSIDAYPSQSTLYTMTVANQSGTRTCAALVTLASQNTQNTVRTGGTTNSYTYSQPSIRTSYTYPTQSASSPTYYQNAVTPRPLYTSGWYPQGTSYSRSYSATPSYTYTSPYSYQSPSYSNGLGEYSLTNIWNDTASGAYLETNQSCYGSWCSSEPDSWSYGDDYFDQYGWYDNDGYVQNRRYDSDGNLIGAAREIDPLPDSYFDNESSYAPGSSSYSSWYDTSSGSGSGYDPYYTSVPGITVDNDGLDSSSYYLPPESSPSYCYPTAQDGGSWENPVMMYSPSSSYGPGSSDGQWSTGTEYGPYPSEYTPPDYNSWVGDEGWI
jgi:hypothetical protein